MTDYYAILDIPSNASAEEIKRSYRRLALRYHPDKAGPEGVVRFREIQGAYEILSNPKKRALYDRYGAAAVNSEISGDLIQRVGIFVTLILFSFVSIILVSLVIVFIAFISAYVDGLLPARDVHTLHDESRSYWNYVKVFSPIFAADIIAVLSGIRFIIISCRLCRIIWLLCTISMLLLAAVSVIVPITKDYNDVVRLESIRNGNVKGGYRSWLVWLTPLYIAAVVSSMADIIASSPTSRRFEELKAFGLERLWPFVKFTCVTSVLRGICAVALSILIACRADDVISLKYFVILGTPFFVYGALKIIDRALYLYTMNKAQTTGAKWFSVISGISPDLVVIGLILASVSMVSKRLDDVSRGVSEPLELAKALSPIYVLLAIAFIFSLLVACNVICAILCRTVRFSYHEPRPHCDRVYEEEGNVNEMYDVVGGTENTDRNADAAGSEPRGPSAAEGTNGNTGNQAAQQERVPRPPLSLTNID